MVPRESLSVTEGISIITLLHAKRSYVGTYSGIYILVYVLCLVMYLFCRLAIYLCFKGPQ